MFFRKKSVAKFSKHFAINKYLINLELNKELPYSQLYILGFTKLEIFKTYIETSLANSFIQLSKAFMKASIIFV